MTFKTSFTLNRHLKNFDSHRKSDQETGPIVIKIRIPASSSESDNGVKPQASTLACKWKDCNATFPNPPALLLHLKSDHAETGEERCLWAKCTHSSPQLKQHFISHLPKSYKPVECEVSGCGNMFRTATHMRSHVYGMHPDVFVARTGPDAKKRKRKGYVEREDNHDAKRLRVDSDSDDSDDEPLSKQHRYRAPPATKPADDKIAYVDDVKNPNGHTGDTKPDDALEDEDMIIDEDEDDTDTDWVRASSTAIATPEKEQSPPKSIALAICANSNTGAGAAADERLLAVELRVKNLETQLAAALGVIRQSEVLRAEWIDRMSESADADELEEEWNASTAIETSTMTEEEDEPDDWSLWVMGAL